MSNSDSVDPALLSELSLTYVSASAILFCPHPQGFVADHGFSHRLSGTYCSFAAFSTCTITLHWVEVLHDWSSDDLLCPALLLFDHLLTLSGEINFIWRRKLNAATIIFALNRYITLMSKIFLLVDELYWPGQTSQVGRVLRCLGFGWADNEILPEVKSLRSVLSCVRADVRSLAAQHHIY